ncbi:MAG TPA: hypothetical protein VN039_10535 [Nitrospira sp.]|nr:hypothetical protein [Nitrospira sp.]
MSLVTVTFEMSNGSILKCEYGYTSSPATFWEPEDVNVGDPTYYIDDDEISYDDLPKGLDKIADALYEADARSAKFSYRESEYERDYDFEDYDR